MTEPIKVATVGDIDDEEAIVVPGDVNGTGNPIAVFFTEDEYYALDDTCTHAEASLADGWVEGCEVECPIHAAKFNLCTGQAMNLPATIPVRTHKVEVRGDEIWLHPGVPVEGAVLEADQ